MAITGSSTVRDLALEVPGAARVFEKIGIDYCCGGAKPLEEACVTAGVSVQDVVRSLEDASTQPGERVHDRDWQAEPLTALVSHIIQTHHAFDRQELERLEPLLAKLRSVYGQSHPEVVQIERVFSALKQDLLNHMAKEEQVLFPYIVQLQQAIDSGSAKPLPFFGTVNNPIRMMMMEHDAAGDMLRNIRELSSNYTPPADTCVTYKTVYESLEELERDLHTHIHLENNLLFPRAIEVEGLN